MNLSQLSQIAIQAALSAGKVIQKHRNDEVKVEIEQAFKFAEESEPGHVEDLLQGVYYQPNGNQ